MHKIPKQELENRMTRFRALMTAENSDWEIAYIFTRVNLYYFTGTMQDSVLIIPRDSEATLWVRLSYERAKDESNFANIKQMKSYRTAASAYSNIPATAYIEKGYIPFSLWERFNKYFATENIKSLDSVISRLRWKKSTYELNQLRTAGSIHQKVLELELPKILHEGMSEADLMVEIFRLYTQSGHQGVFRINSFEANLLIGQIAFGENSIYPTNFDGPGGNKSDFPASPFMGSVKRKLKLGDIVFVDSPVNVNGYHSDKTMVYSFGKTPDNDILEQHSKCVEIRDKIAEMLKPGALPEDIYNTIMADLSPKFLENFMGFGNRQVKFLGHGIGLFIDELPVIANGFKMPLEEGMCFALEPKKGIKNVGMIGVEESYVVTPTGGECITGNHKGLIVV